MRLNHVRRNTVTLSAPHQSALRHGLRASLTFFPLMGLGWVFGPMAVGDAAYLQYVFTILNSFQVGSVCVCVCVCTHYS